MSNFLSASLDELFGPSDPFFTESFLFTSPSKVCNSNFPPSNVSINAKTRELKIKVALAGVSEDKISLVFENDTIKLRVQDANTVDDDEQEVFPSRHLKLVKNETISWKIDLHVYDRDSANVKFENGLLTITLMPIEQAPEPKCINLFGNLDRTLEVKE